MTNWLICFSVATVTLIQGSDKHCDPRKTELMLEVVDNMYKKQPALQPVPMIHDTTSDPLNMQRSLEHVLNQAIENTTSYYKVKEAKAAVTCFIEKEFTTLVIVQLAKTTCTKSQVLSGSAKHHECEFTNEIETIDCTWSGGGMASLFTYGYWCVRSTEIDIDYPKPEDLCHTWRYESTTAFRLPVPEQYRPWTKVMLAYKPPQCYVYRRFGNADCTKFTMDDLESLKETLPNEFQYSEGRTGIRGRGAYTMLGANDFLQFILIRESYNGDKQVTVERSGLKLGHFVLPKLPTDRVVVSSPLGSTVTKFLQSKTKESEKKLWPDHLQSATKIYSDVMQDTRNTDNAWMRLHSYLVMDNNLLMVTEHEADSDYTWVTIDETMHDYLRDVVTKVMSAGLAEQILKPTNNTILKTARLPKSEIVRETMEMRNCIASLYPNVSMVLSSSDYFGTVILSAFYF